MEQTLNTKILLSLYPEYDSVLGPYIRKDKRKHVILNNSKAKKGTKGKTKTISYPKALMESIIGKRLLKNETIDHIDNDYTNDEFSNLRILDIKTHCYNDAIKYQETTIPCLLCGTLCQLSRDKIRNRVKNSSKNKCGPFCSKSCTGKYGKLIQLGRIDKYPVDISFFIKAKNKY